MKTKLPILALAAFVAMQACESDRVVLPAPLDRPYFPYALAQSDNEFFLLSDDSDLRYSTGNLLGFTIDPTNFTHTLKHAFRVPTLARGLAVRGKYAFFVSSERGQLTVINLDTQVPYPHVLLSYAFPSEILLFDQAPGTDEITGVIGYTSQIFRRRAVDQSEIDSLGGFGEIQKFTWNPNDPSNIQFDQAVSLTKLARNQSDTTDFSRFLERGQLGGLTLIPAKTPGLNLQEPWLVASVSVFRKIENAAPSSSAKIVAFRVSDFVPTMTRDKTVQFDLYEAWGATIAGSLALYQNQIYMITRLPDAVAQINLVQPFGYSSGALKTVCDAPLRVLPANGIVYVSCGMDNGAVEAYSTIDLRLQARKTGADIGRGPFGLSWYAPANSLIVANYLEGTLSVLDPTSLQLKKKLFPPAPLNRDGGL